MVNKPFIRPYFWGEYVRGGWLTSHEFYQQKVPLPPTLMEVVPHLVLKERMHLFWGLLLVADLTWRNNHVLNHLYVMGFKTICFGLFYTLLKMNMSLKILKRDHFKRKIVFQPAFFRGYVSFRGSMS